jgi:replicative DNA helicase
MVWLRSLGLEGRTAQDKFVPQQYLGSSDETHKEILRGLWESDGTVTGGNAKYTTCSEMLARQVKWLLHTIGVRATVNRYENGFAGLWEVLCAAEDNIRMQDICSNRARFGALSVPSDRYIDPAPAIFVELANELYRGKQRFQRRSSGVLKQIPKARMESVLAACRIATIAESPYMTMHDMGWATLTSVELRDEDVHVCDLQVPNTHCFLSNGLVVHNSGAIEQDADVILFVHVDRRQNKDADHSAGTRKMILAKQRDGDVGVWQMEFYRQFQHFQRWERMTA